jgi:hypothetical protein
MTDGQILKAFIEGKEIKREAFAKSMKMSRQALYGIYKSKAIKPETKQAIERSLKLPWVTIAEYAKSVNVDDNASRETSKMQEADPPYGFKDKYILSLERENERLRRDLELSLGEMRHSILLTRAIAETNQDFLIELLAKQRKVSLDVVGEESNRLNFERYMKLKEEGNFPYAGK